MSYQYSKNVKLPFEVVFAMVEDALQEEGFTMTTSLDIKKQIATDLGIRFRNYRIIKAVVPELSYKAITLDPHIGILIACTVVVHEHENGVVEIFAANPMNGMDHNMSTASLETVANDLGTRLRKALDSVNIKRSVFSLEYN